MNLPHRIVVVLANVATEQIFLLYAIGKALKTGVQEYKISVNPATI
jgi:hypothetical protein